MITVLEEMDKCVGCSSCAQRCIKKCITMKPDNEGFLFPDIDQGNCNDCGACRKACPVFDNNIGSFAKATLDDKPKPTNVYACWNNNDETRLKSSSGGLFSLFAENTIKEGGAVFGAAFDDEFQVHHTCVRNIDALDTQRGSKYVQSTIGNNFLEVEVLLKAGNKVLFAGTPCQIAGLKAFLGKEYDKLLTIDLACNGVPSPKIWSMYLEYMKDLYKSNIKHISFRNKKDGWTKSSMKIDFDNGKTYIENVYKETYFLGYGKGIFNRKCCYKCNFKLKNTKSDITLADFWGVEKLQGIPIRDNKGVSLLISNTTKGSTALSDIKCYTNIYESLFEEAVKGNPRLLTSCSMPEAREKFFKAIKTGSSFQKLRHKYMNNYGLTYKIKVAAKSMLSPKLIETLNKLRTR